MLWKGLSVASASSSPIVVVLSGSMEPAFQRGDLLFLWNRSPRTEVGEIVVYNVSISSYLHELCVLLTLRKGARKGYPHRPPRGSKLPRGRGKDKEGQGDHSVSF
jgi:signal peptidase I